MIGLSIFSTSVNSFSSSLRYARICVKTKECLLRGILKNKFSGFHPSVPHQATYQFIWVYLYKCVFWYICVCLYGVQRITLGIFHETLSPSIVHRVCVCVYSCNTCIMYKNTHINYVYVCICVHVFIYMLKFSLPGIHHWPCKVVWLFNIPQEATLVCLTRAGL